MTPDDESAERSQRTVAELLAQYGDGAATGRRRSRRRSEDTGGQPAAGVPTQQSPDHGANDERASSGTPPQNDGTPDNGASPSRAQQGFDGYPSAPRQGSPVPVYAPGQGTVGPADESETARWYQQPAHPGRHLGAGPAPAAPGASFGGYQPAPGLEPPTDQLPRHAPNGAPVHTNGRAVATGYGARPGTAGSDQLIDESGEPTGYLSPDDLDSDVAGLAPDDQLEHGAGSEPADARRGERPGAENSPTTAWLAMVAQWIGGAIGGAALWMAFRYLWAVMPVVALVAAVLVIGGLVLLVRTIRRSDDLRTTVFAVLVGLVVTVSPAVLVLVQR